MMQDDFNSAPTPRAQPAPPPYPPIAPAAQPPRAPAPGDQTVTFHGAIPANEPPTVALPPTPPTYPAYPAYPGAYPAYPAPQPPGAPWPGQPGLASPNAPTVYHPQPSAPAPIPAPLPAPLPAPIPAPRRAAPPSSAPARPQPRSQARPMTQARSRPRARRGLPIPWPHTLLLVGVALLFLATLLPWGVDGSGALVSIQTATVSSVIAQANGSALQVANSLVGAVAVLSVALILLNVILLGLNTGLRALGAPGCATLLFSPALLALIALLLIVDVAAAGFGGQGDLGQFITIAGLGPGPLGGAHRELGFYAWYAGIALNALGTFGQLGVRR